MRNSIFPIALFLGIIFQVNAQFSKLAPASIVYTESEINLPTNSFWANALDELLSKSNFPKPENIAWIKKKKVSCYDNASVIEYATIIDDTTYLYNILNVGANNILLEGHSDDVYNLNRIVKLSLNTEAQILEYLSLFVNNLNGSDGRFRIISGYHDLQPYSHSKLPAKLPIMKPAIIEQNDDEILIKANVLYDEDLFTANFKVSRSGIVSMIDDSLITSLDVFCDKFYKGRIQFYNLINIYERKPLSIKKLEEEFNVKISFSSLSKGSKLLPYSFSSNKIQFTKVDLSTLEWRESVKGSYKYYVDFEFTIDEPIGKEFSFVFLGMDVHSWGILTDDEIGLVRGFYQYDVGNSTFILQTQKGFNRKFDKGKYIFRLYSNYQNPVENQSAISLFAMRNDRIQELKKTLQLINDDSSIE